METQRTIAEWREETFGKCKDPAKLVGRALMEFKELVEECSPGMYETEWIDGLARAMSSTGSKWANREIDKVAIADEMADVLVVLFGAAADYGFDLQKAVDEKMAINRSRQWEVTGDGQGRHA